MTARSAIELQLREQAPRVLGVLVRRHGDFDRCEDAVQEALLEAHLAWREVPEKPFGWLLTVAERRFVDGLRSDAGRARREQRQALLEPLATAGMDGLDEQDDTLSLLFLCCHPDLPPPSQIALTLRAVGGLTTDEIARALLVSPATLAQRIVRAKARLRGVTFGEPRRPSGARAWPPSSTCSTCSSPKVTPRAPGQTSSATTSPSRPCGSPAACAPRSPTTVRYKA